ncbi:MULTISPECIES: methionine--tRNA ligase [unclassified Beijerinckia]|uniref:methionine--tRNA ligase n=1 Tax=unclassified Beijerinckia TaxID=2638183 RepID=UPI000897DB2B|nr:MULTISPECIES: methionine--tRNA ligase [unclassified Beijerinckia]MDH7795084.1 methionyl-tRNA synthetase [Beijerinckia sp. GAS462]SEB86921.1 methionyl-tRNA synthetase [Beijerinckia sp. 28-YEA-48]
MTAKFCITTAIPYANGKPHIGHAYERIATDAIARFHRIAGEDVFFVTGMDEHGLKMQQTATREGLKPQELADRTAAQFDHMGTLLNARADHVIRTTEPRHYLASRAIWEAMQKKGDIYLSKYAGWYSVREEAYFDEGEITSNSEGQKFSPNGTPVEWVEEESYFFKLSAYADRLLAHYEAHPDFIVPEKYRNEIVSFVKRGLQDLSISRTTFDWGVPVPGDDKHVMYVWVDALTNYLTACGYPIASAPHWHYWPADAHVIGKDITRFHAIYWPAFLMSAEIALPKQIVVHGFLFNRGEKMSKSVGNVVDPLTMAEHYGVDQMRYFFLREVPFGQDGNYSHEALVNRINADLANDLGNLAQRSLSMVTKNCDGKAPVPGALTANDEIILAAAWALAERTSEAMKEFALHTALAEIWKVVADANRYFAGEEPWARRKDNPERMGTILWVTAEVLRNIAIAAQPVIPTAAGKLLDSLAAAPDARMLRHIGKDHALTGGVALPAPVPIFPRYVETEAGATPA